jgi:sulfite reductase alpha subunit-like flavoprotein
MCVYSLYHACLCVTRVCVCVCRDLDKEEFVVFLLATFGEGEPTDNAADFYTWIQDQVSV